MKSSPRSLVIVQLNEINFDLVRKYLGTNELPAFKHLLDRFQQFETFAEAEYQNLEPWIQWVSAHTGLTFSEHGVFRLGDIVNSNARQIFEVLEERGLKVGAISPMNARNDLRNPAFFVPDPWTETPCDSSGFSVRLTRMLRQTVNENAKKVVSMRSKLTIAEAVLRTLGLPETPRLFGLIREALRKPWTKPMVLDQLIHMVHLKKLRSSRPDVSFVFLNAGAHIQHHYLLNSPMSGAQQKNPAWYVPANADPVLDMLKAYDHMLAAYVAMNKGGTHLLVATGLTQEPYNRVKFYYRLREHAQFLRLMKIEHLQVLPRMTRDFEVSFATREHAQRAMRVLSSAAVRRDGLPLFGEIEDRGQSLFVTLSYPSEIQSDDAIVFEGGEVDRLSTHVAFVAVKNGMHSGRGFVFVSPGTLQRSPTAPIHVSNLYDMMLEAAGVPNTVAA